MTTKEKIIKEFNTPLTITKRQSYGAIAKKAKCAKSYVHQVLHEAGLTKKQLIKTK